MPRLIALLLALALLAPGLQANAPAAPAWTLAEALVEAAGDGPAEPAPLPRARAPAPPRTRARRRRPAIARPPRSRKPRGPQARAPPPG